MSSGSPVISPRAKLCALWRVVAASADGAFHLFLQRRIERHVAGAGKIDKTLGEIGIIGRKRRLDLASRDVGIEFVIERAIGNAGRIVEAIERIDGARHRVDRGQSEQKHSRESRPDPRRAHYAWLFQRCVSINPQRRALLPANQGVSAARGG